MKIKVILTNILSYLLPIIGGFLGAWGGTDNSSKIYRRIYIPLLLTGCAFGELENIFVFTIMSMAGAISMGYGIPDETDNGSFLGRFWLKLFKNNHLLANIFTRGTIGLLIGLSLISIPILKHNWLVYIVGYLGICMVNALISWRNFGSYHLFNKELSWVETITWGLITLFASLIIKIG